MCGCCILCRQPSVEDSFLRAATQHVNNDQGQGKSESVEHLQTRRSRKTFELPQLNVRTRSGLHFYVYYTVILLNIWN